MNLQQFQSPNVSCPAFVQHFQFMWNDSDFSSYDVQASNSRPTRSAAPCNWRNTVNVLCDHPNEDNWNHTVIKSAAIECDDFMIAVLVNGVEDMKHKKLKEYQQKNVV
jgi:hypothetical protein